MSSHSKRSLKMKKILDLVKIRLINKKEIKMARAEARHILVDSEEKCLELKKEIKNGAKFETVAQAHSSCPSSRDGGNLGEFGPGQMVFRSVLDRYLLT